MQGETRKALCDLGRSAWRALCAPPRSTLSPLSFARLYRAELRDPPATAYYRARDDHPLPYVSYGDATCGRRLVLIHGAAGHGGHLHTLASAVAASGAAQVSVLTMRGHGGDSGLVRYPEQLSDDVADFLAIIRRDGHGAPIILGGHSAGAGLALRVASSAAGEQLQGFILLAPFFGVAAPTTRTLCGGWIRPRIGRICGLVALNLMGINRFNRLSVVTFNQPLDFRDGRETLEWTFSTLLAFGPRTAVKDLAVIGSRPALLVAGRGDECFLAEAYESFLTRCGPQVQGALIDEAGHWDILVAQETSAAVCAWLSRMPRSCGHPSAPHRAGAHTR